MTFLTQQPTLAALDRLTEICRRHSITREQAMAAVEAVRRRWFEWEGSQLFQMIPKTDLTPAVANASVRSTILGELMPAEKELLWGGMDVTRYAISAEGFEASSALTGRAGRDIGRAGRVGPSDCYAVGSGAYLEYRYSSHHVPIRGVRLHVDDCNQDGGVRIGLWWPDEAGKWSVVSLSAVAAGRAREWTGCLHPIVGFAALEPWRMRPGSTLCSVRVKHYGQGARAGAVRIKIAGMRTAT